MTAAPPKDQEGRDLAPFDPAAPLPPMPDYRARSWEPAARHYRDLDDHEKEGQA